MLSDSLFRFQTTNEVVATNTRDLDARLTPPIPYRSLCLVRWLSLFVTVRRVLRVPSHTNSVHRMRASNVVLSALANLGSVGLLQGVNIDVIEDRVH